MSMRPRNVGKYELLELLGSGGMGEVWKAFDTQLHRYVAIKFLRTVFLTDRELINRFHREAQIAASLRHPNIIQIYDAHLSFPQESDADADLHSSWSAAYMVMDYVEGQTLADYIRVTSRAQRFPSGAEIVRLFIPISSAIDYAHQHRMIHRDIKPANILLDKRNTINNPMGEPILTDFGLVKELGTATGALTHQSIGTPLYISPEQARGHSGNEASDIYSLGIILYEMLTGITPFQGNKPLDIVLQHVTTAPTPPMLINPNIPPAANEVILRALAKDPATRFSSASSMTAALAEAFHIPVLDNLGQPTYPINNADRPTYFTPLPSKPDPDVTRAYSDSASIQPSAFPPMAGPPVSPPRAGLDERPQLNVVSPRDTPVSSSSSAATPPIDSGSQNRPPLPPSQAKSEMTPSSSPLAPPTKTQGTRRKSLFTILAVLVVIGLLGSGLGAFFLFARGNGGGTTTTATTVGYVYFQNSGQVDENSNKGQNDILQINLSNINDPASGKACYAWLLRDQNQLEAVPIQLGQVKVENHTINVTYKGDPQNPNLNLLANYSQFLITEEDATIKPLSPSPDTKTWRYYSIIPQKPIPGDTVHHYSMLDHLRHLLASDPTLDKYGLPGGLNIWLLRNTQKVFEWASSARDDGPSGQTDLLHRLVVRILDYLDGLAFVQQDAPGEPVEVNSKFAQLPLLPLQMDNNHPPYLTHVGLHLSTIKLSPDLSPEKSRLIDQLTTALNQVNAWLMQVHNDAKQLVTMSSQQLSQPSTQALLNDMLTQASYAYSGQANTSNGQIQSGAQWIYSNVPRLATFSVTTYKAQ